MTVRRFVEFQQFGGPEVLVIAEGPLGAPGPGEVAVAIDAIGVNFADTMVRRGEYRRGQTAPHIPGMEAAGRILSCGPGVSLQPGTPVAVFCEQGGGYSSHLVISEDLVFEVDPTIEPALVAASFLQGVTAWYAIHRYAHAKPGDLILVTGAAGGLGSWVAQLAIDAGAEVVGLASTAAKRTQIREMGCLEALSPQDPDLTSRLRDIAPQGFTSIVDGVGGPLFSVILPSLAKNGHFVVVGSATQQAATLDVRHLMPRGQTISGFVVRNVIDSDPGEPENALREVLSRVADGRVRLDVRTMPLSAAAEAHRGVERRDVIGKLVLDPAR